VLRPGDGRVQEDAVVAELHRARGVGGRPDAGVDDQREVGDQLADEAEGVGVHEPHPAPDGGRQRHHGGAAEVGQLAGGDGVVAAVGEDVEAVADELVGRLQELNGVGVERLVVADHLQLDEVGGERLAGELRGEDGLAGGVAAGGVGQEVERPADGRGARAEGAEEGLPLACQIDAPHGHRHELRARGVDRVEERLEAGVAARPEEHARGEREPAGLPRVGRRTTDDGRRGAVGARGAVSVFVPHVHRLLNRPARP
jgi:hypothetical protein